VVLSGAEISWGDPATAHAVNWQRQTLFPQGGGTETGMR
jgi:hypothetical protein